MFTLKLNAETQIMYGSPCGRCRHGLPDFEVTHIVGPWSGPDKLLEALRGTLNQVTCPLCDYIGTLHVPLLICAPHRNRIITVIGGNYIIPQLQAIEAALEVLLKARVGADTSLLNLPRQKTTNVFDLPKILEVPDDAVWLDDRSAKDRNTRLNLPPRAKAAKLIAQMLEVIDIQVAQQLPDYKTCGDKYAGATIDIALLFQPTPFEQTTSGRKAIKRAFGKIESNLRSHERYHLTGFLRKIEDDKVHDEVRVIRRHRRTRLRRKFIAVIENFQPFANPPDAPNALARRLSWLFAAQYICASNHPTLGLDYCEAYIRTVDMTNMSLADAGVFALFGSLLYRNGPAYDGLARRYLYWAVLLLPLERATAGEISASIGAFAREYLGHVLMGEGNLEHALHYYKEGVSLYQIAGDKERSAELMESIVTIADMKREPEILTRLAQQGEALNSLGPYFALFRHVLERDSQHENFDGEPTGRVRTAVASFYRGDIHDVQFRWGSTLKPLNFDPEDENVKHPIVWADLEIAIPFSARSWTALNRYPRSVACENLVGRIINIRGERAFLEYEVLLKHPLMEWAQAAAGARERGERLNAVQPTLWAWGASNKMFGWLADEWTRSKFEYGDRSHKWPTARRLGLGLAFAQLAASPDVEIRERRRWFAEQAIDLLGLLVAGANSRDPIFRRLSSQIRFDVRRALGRCYELIGRLPEAVEAFEENINAAFAMRHQSGNLAQRAIIQEHVGGDAGRLNRVRFRLHGFPPPECIAHDVFWTVELTRARVLVDRLMRTDIPEALLALDNDLDASEGLDVSLSAALVERIGPPPGNYLQISLVQSYDDFSGFWLAAIFTEQRKVSLAKLDWTTPSDIYHRLGNILASIGDTTFAKPAVFQALVRNLLRLSRWVNNELLPLFDAYIAEQDVFDEIRWISPAAYLVAMPWSFCSIAQSRMRSTRPGAGLSCLGVAFSGMTLSVASARQRISPTSSTIHVYVDPLGDLPESRAQLEMKLLSSSVLRERHKLFTGLEASAARFLVSVGEADVVCFLGHGNGRLHSETTRLVFSLGRQVDSQSVCEVPMKVGVGARVAVLLACWGGRLEEFHNSWEAEGMPYSLKFAGFDYVVSSAWPISSRMATEFLSEFLQLLGEDADVDVAFFKAYDSLIERFGLYAVSVEAASLRLNA